MSAIQFAQFGSKAQAHDVLRHSGVDPTLLSGIIWRTDAPPDSPGLGLEPFLSAYRYNDHYVVQTTRADPDAGRPGMVLTTSALVPVDNLYQLDIAALWEAIQPEGFDCERELDAANFAPTPDEAPDHIHPPGAAAVASALLTARRVVWTGPGLQEAVACVWSHLQYEDRLGLVVGAAARPNALSVPLEANTLGIIATAPSVIARWTSWPLASLAAAAEADPAREAMFGDDGGRSADLAQRLELRTATAEQWRFLARAATWAGQLTALNHEQSRSLLQLFGQLQPDQTRGVQVKQEVLGHLQGLTAAAPFDDVRGLRAVPWAALPPGSLGALLQGWSGTVASDPALADEMTHAIAGACAKPTDEFFSELDACLRNDLAPQTLHALADTVMRHSAGAEVLTWLAGSGITIDDIDRAVSAAAAGAPSVPVWLTKSAQLLNLPLCHATSVDVDDPTRAWAQQLELRPRSEEAEDLLASRTGAAGVVAAALTFSDHVLTTRAALAVAKDGSLLAGGSVSDDRFRTIWFEAVSLGADPWSVMDPSKAVHYLLDLLAQGEPVEPKVLISLSHTTAADINSYPSRASVWSRLPGPAVPGFMSATAQTFARSYKPGDQAPEPQLQTAVLEPPLLESIARESPAQAVALLGLRSASATDASRVISTARFNSSEAMALASIVVQRRWRTTADVIIGLSSTRTDLADAAVNVSGLFSPLERLLRSFTGHASAPAVSPADLRSAFAELASNLYAAGPQADSIWERAGGQEADLLTADTGRLMWGHAVEAAFEGRRGAPSPDELLDAMLSDYPKSDKLQALKKALSTGA